MPTEGGWFQMKMRLVPALVVPLALAASLALTGCGEGAGDGGGNAADARTVKVAKSFWHSGFKVTLGTATVVSPPTTGTPAVTEPPTMTIEATFQNLGESNHAFPSPMVISSAGKHHTQAGPQQELPVIPGQASQSGTIAFVVDESFRLLDAVLTVGSADRRQAVVPLTSADGLVSLAPRAFEVNGKASNGPDFYATVESGELRADNPEGYGEAKAGNEFLRLRFSVTNDGPGMLAILYGLSNRLSLPDGSSVGITTLCGNPQLHPGPHATAREGVVCFEVPAPAGGEYLYAITGDDAEGLRFTIA